MAAINDLILTTLVAYSGALNDRLIQFYEANLTAWLTATGYTTEQIRTEGGVVYVCLIDHTSGVFATDLAAGKWEVETLNISAAENEFLKARAGVTTTNTPDMWFQYLRGKGYTGAIRDMKLQWWTAGVPI